MHTLLAFCARIPAWLSDLLNKGATFLWMRNDAFHPSAGVIFMQGRKGDPPEQWVASRVNIVGNESLHLCICD